ncbi:MAG TPA: Fe-S cluster assembly protein NifU [Elusimicrobiales bacterium]|nr:Fe-S cluster assembly protein NifU [Elusimicrobiales bacterium]
MWDYTDKVKDHFKNPRNVGSIPDADAVGEVGNIVCGDALKLFLKLDATGKISDAKFQTFGCGSAIASSSALTELIKGMTLEEASKVTNKQIADYLGGLPEEKMHCSVMGMEALEAAIKSYQQGGKPVVHEEDEDGEIVCKCFGVTDKKILRAIKENNLHTVDEVTHFTKAGGACGKCRDKIEKLLDPKHHETPSAKPFSSMTPIQKIHAVEEVLRREISPQLNADGGSVEFVDMQGELIKVKLLGMCKGCPSAGLTLKSFIEKRLRELLDPALRVEAED